MHKPPTSHSLGGLGATVGPLPKENMGEHESGETGWPSPLVCLLEWSVGRPGRRPHRGEGLAAAPLSGASFQIKQFPPHSHSFPPDNGSDHSPANRQALSILPQPAWKGGWGGGGVGRSMSASCQHQRRDPSTTTTPPPPPHPPLSSPTTRPQDCEVARHARSARLRGKVVTYKKL